VRSVFFPGGMKNLTIGDRVVNTFPIGAENCLLCKEGINRLRKLQPEGGCKRSSGGIPHADIVGYSQWSAGFTADRRSTRGFPDADVGPIKGDRRINDEKVLFCRIFPTDTWPPNSAASAAATRSRSGLRARRADVEKRC